MAYIAEFRLMGASTAADIVMRHPLNGETNEAAQRELLALRALKEIPVSSVGRVKRVSTSEWMSAAKVQLAAASQPVLGLTSMEADILRAFARTHSALGFPQPEEITVTGREHSGNGRFTAIHSTYAFGLAGPIDAPILIHMPLVRNGMTALVWLKEGRLSDLEIVAFGGDFWSGDETGYSVTHPRQVT